jgi:D-amino-acid dehydrogenase
MAGDTERRAVVIGAGIVGVCCAIELQRRGWAVTLVDKGAPGEACSFGNAGVLAAQSYVPIAAPGVQSELPRLLLNRESPLVLRWRSLPTTLPWLMHFRRAATMEKVGAASDALKAMNSSSLELHEALAREAGVPELVRPTRYLYVHRNAAALDAESGLAWRLRRERGSEIEVLDGPALWEAEPALSHDYKRGIRLGPMGYTLNPFRLTQSYARLFESKGGTVKRATVAALKPEGPRVGVETDGGRFDCETAVVAAGAWSMTLLKPLGLKLPLIAERGYHMTFSNPGITLNHVISDAERQFAITLMEMGLRAAGTEELGLPDEAPAWRRAEILRRQTARLLPGADLSNGSRWMGPRPGTPDSLPAIGPVPGHPNIYIAAGHGHLGLTGGPNTGRIVAALAHGERINIDLAPYAPGRFQ